MKPPEVINPKFKRQPEVFQGMELPLHYEIFSYANELVEQGLNAVVVGRALALHELDKELVLVWFSGNGGVLQAMSARRYNELYRGDTHHK